MADSLLYSLEFLQKHALDSMLALSEQERELLNKINVLIKNADEVVICLGGKAGRLGECVVGTGLLEATLQALRFLGKDGGAVTIIVDESARELFDERLYQTSYWPEITVTATRQITSIQEIAVRDARSKHVLTLDFHGANDGLPALQMEAGDSDQIGSLAMLTHLFRVGFRSYAQRGVERRYADFIEDLFALPRGAIDGKRAQPTILLSPVDRARYAEAARAYGLDSGALQIICFFQSVVPAKCYERWDEVLQLLCQYFAEHFPAQTLNFLLACGPDDDLPVGIRKADLEEWLEDFTGVDNNARVVIRRTSSLRELAILTAHAALALSNDTGPGHIAGALAVPTVTVYLPGNLYSRSVWSSTPWHHGVTREPNPYTFEQLQAAVVWRNTDIINSIAPEALLAVILSNLPEEFRPTEG